MEGVVGQEEAEGEGDGGGLAEVGRARKLEDDFVF